mgnify:CR=1 FL=1
MPWCTDLRSFREEPLTPLERRRRQISRRDTLNVRVQRVLEHRSVVFVRRLDDPFTTGVSVNGCQYRHAISIPNNN